MPAPTTTSPSRSTSPSWPPASGPCSAGPRRPGRRCSRPPTSSSIRAAHTVRRAGVLVPLTAREFALLHYLMDRAGTVVRRTDLLEAVWDANYDGLVERRRRPRGQPAPQARPARQPGADRDRSRRRLSDRRMSDVSWQGSRRVTLRRLRVRCSRSCSAWSRASLAIFSARRCGARPANKEIREQLERMPRRRWRSCCAP